MLMARQQAQK